MPQMSPLPWMSLMLFFIMILLIMATIISHNNTPNKYTASKDSTKINKPWMW